MRRIFKLFHRELKNVREAAFLLAAATIASNVLGLMRDRLLAARFGAGSELDAYYAAFRVPDFLYTISLFFVASTALIPLFLERYTTEHARAYAFIQTVFAVFFVCITIIAGIAFMLMPRIVPFLTPGFDPAAQTEVVYIARIMLISPVLLGISNIISGVLQAFRRFLVYAASFLFYNLGIIGGILFFVPRWGLRGLAWGVVLGAVLHVSIQIPSLLRMGYRPLAAAGAITDMMPVFYRSLPRTLGLASMQITFAVITAVASTIGSGAIAVFQLSYNLQSIPLAVIGLSYSVAAFPTMAEMIVKKEHSVFFEHLVSSARHIIFWTLPVSILFIVLRAQIVRVVLGAGAFSWADTRLTAASLALFAIGIVAQSLSALFIRAFYAIGNTRIPVVINMCSMAVTIGAAVLFVRIIREAGTAAQMFSRMLRVEDIAGNAVLALPLAFALGAVANAFFLGIFLRRIDGTYRPYALGSSLFEIGTASALLGFVSYAMLQVVAPLVDLERFSGIFLQGLLAGLAGIGTALLFLHMRGNKEYYEVRSVLSRKFWRNETIGPEQEHL